MDAMQLLGSLLGNNATSSGVGGQLLSQLVASLNGGGNAGSARMGGGGQQMLGQLVSSLSGGGRPAAGGAGGVDLASLLGLAMNALQAFGQRSAAAGSASPLAALAGGMGLSNQPSAGFAAAAPPPNADQQALVLVRAMINAAKADGQIDAQEQQNISAKLTGVGPEEIAFVQAELAKPLNFDFLADASPDLAFQVYAASLMAINVDTPAENQYLQKLAQGLGLNDQTINAIHGQLGLAPLFG